MIGPGTSLVIGYAGTTGTIEGNVVDNGQLSFDPASAIVFGGTISGSGSVGIGSFGPDGSVTLTGDNSYTGGTWIGSTLIVGNANALGSSAGSVTIFYGTLDLNGYNVTVGNVVGYAGTITPGNGGPSILTTGDLTIYSGMQYVAEIDGSTAGTGYSQVQANGEVYLGGATLVLTGAGAGSGSPIVLITSTGGVEGTFAGLPQGATVTYQGVTYQISYDYNPNGGTGTDVALVPV